MDLHVAVFVAPNGQRRDATLPIADALEAKVEAILNAGFRFEGEYLPSMITTPITGEHADYGIVVSTDLMNQSAHVAKVEEMIRKFNIENCLRAEAEAA